MTDSQPGRMSCGPIDDSLEVGLVGVSPNGEAFP